MEEIFTVEVTDTESGKRIDKFLAEKLPGSLSRAFVQKLISGGSVKMGGAQVKRNHRVRAGDLIEVKVPEPIEPVVRPENIPIDIVYEDEDIAVVNKGPDMVVHPAPGNYSGTLVNALLWRCKNLSGIGGVLKPGIVHRLDKGTSGILVVAKNDHAHKALAKQFKDKTTRRLYVALVKGVMELDNGLIELPIARHVRDRKKMAVNFDEEGKAAVTRYKVLNRFKDCTLAELILGTGRTHQIRVHMAYIGHPVLGDEKYGSKDGFSRPLLHAKMLGFVHPGTGKYMEFNSELPEDMRSVIEKESGVKGKRK